MANEKKPWQKGILNYTRDFLGGMFGRKPSQSQPQSQSQSQSQPQSQSKGGFTSAEDFVRERVEEARERLQERNSAQQPKTDQRTGAQQTPRTTQPSVQQTPRSSTGAASQARNNAEEIAENLREAAQRAQAKSMDEAGGVAAQVGGKRSYTVMEGDSLSKIALRFYGDATQWQKIYNANRDKISNPDLIYPGQDLVIP